MQQCNVRNCSHMKRWLNTMHICNLNSWPLAQMQKLNSLWVNMKQSASSDTCEEKRKKKCWRTSHKNKEINIIQTGCVSVAILLRNFKYSDFGFFLRWQSLSLRSKQCINNKNKQINYHIKLYTCKLNSNEWNCWFLNWFPFVFCFCCASFRFTASFFCCCCCSFREISRKTQPEK